MQHILPQSKNPHELWMENEIVTLTKSLPHKHTIAYYDLKVFPFIKAVRKHLSKVVDFEVEIGRTSQTNSGGYIYGKAILKLGHSGIIVLDWESHPNKMTFHFHTLEKDFSTLRLAVHNFIKPYLEMPDNNEAAWKFVYQTAHGLVTSKRMLPCQAFSEVRDNYPGQQKIADLILTTRPYERGKLIFWYGVPGTGKTYAIRALARQWKNAQFLYITQPEVFFRDFGGMYSIIMENTEEKQTGKNKDKFLVLVVEDALDLLLQETRIRDSSTISRMLNLTEGIIGQGMKIVVLITSNEKVDSIDNAFLRPGRCLQNLEFKTFSPEQAEQWLKRHDYTGSIKEPKKEKTLAQLYQILSGEQDIGTDMKVSTDKRVGFKGKRK